MMKIYKMINRLLKSNLSKESSHNEELLSSLLMIAWVVEARDPYTGGHLWRVSRFANLLAQALALPDAVIAQITIGAFLHDLGKVGIPDHILGKKGKLTDKEYGVIQTHPSSGWDMIVKHPLAWVAETAIKFHHERPDGKGYPYGLVDEELPIDAKVVAICDAFDAMTSTRPYRHGLPTQKALSIIENNLGTQFDTNSGRIFIDLARNGLLDHVIGHSDDGIPLQSCIMCGPILVIRSDQKPGDTTYCPSCMRKYSLIQKEKRIEAVATGDIGLPKDILKKPDAVLIDNLIKQVLPALELKTY